MNTVFASDSTPFVLKHRAIKKTNASGAAATMAPDTISLSSITRSAAVATATATAAHRLAVGQALTISGATGSVAAFYNGTVRVVSIPSATTFTFALSADPGADAAGTLVAKYHAFCQWAVVVADSANSADISIGPDVNADHCVLTHGLTPPANYLLQVPSGEKFNLADWYMKSGSASQSYSVLFL